MDVNFEYKGYQITLINYKGEKFDFELTEEDFFEKKHLICWIDFLIKTNQWIPYDLYRDVFVIEEYKYQGLENIKEIKVQYVEIINKYINVNLDLM